MFHIIKDKGRWRYEIVVDCCSKYRVKVRKKHRFFVRYVFFHRGKESEGLERGTRNYRVQAFSMLPLLVLRSFISPYEGRNRGQRESWPNETSGDTFGITGRHREILSISWLTSRRREFSRSIFLSFSFFSDFKSSNLFILKLVNILSRKNSFVW